MNLKLKEISFFKIKSRDTSNIAFSLLSYLLTPLVLLFSTPLLLKHLGPENYGFWVLINSIIVVMTISNFGLGNAMIKLGAGFIQIKEKFSLLFEVTFTITFCLAILVNLLSLFAGKFVLIHILPQFSDVQIQQVSIMLGGIVGFRIISSVISGTYMAKQRYDLNSKVNIVVNLLSAIVFTFVAVISSNLIEMMYVLFASTIVLTCINWVVARKISPEIKIKFRIEKNTARQVMGFGFYSGAQVIISTLYTQADKFLVSFLLGPAVLGYYTVCMQIASKIHEIPAAAGSYLFAKFSSLYEAKDYITIKKVYYRGMLICGLFLLLACGAVLLFSKDILTIWINPIFAQEHYRFMQILTTGVALGALGVIPYYCLNGTGYIKANTIVNFLISASTLGSMSLLIPLIGLNGVSIGKMAGFPFVIYSCFIIEKKILRKNSSREDHVIRQQTTMINRG